MYVSFYKYCDYSFLKRVNDTNIDAFHFFVLRVDSPLGVRGKGQGKRKNEMRPTYTPLS